MGNKRRKEGEEERRREEERGEREERGRERRKGGQRREGKAWAGGKRGEREEERQNIPAPPPPTSSLHTAREWWEGQGKRSQCGYLYYVTLTFHRALLACKCTPFWQPMDLSHNYKCLISLPATCYMAVVPLPHTSSNLLVHLDGHMYRMSWS